MLDIESAWLEKVDDILGCFRLIGGVKEHAVVNLVLQSFSQLRDGGNLLFLDKVNGSVHHILNRFNSRALSIPRLVGTTKFHGCATGFKPRRYIIKQPDVVSL